MSTGQLDEKTDDYINAYVENWIIGYAKGIAEGELSKALQIARNMKSKGLPISDISEMTGLSLEELEKL